MTNYRHPPEDDPENENVGRTLGDIDLRLEERLIMANKHKVTREDLRLMHEQLCEQARGLMKLKNVDYATSDDPFRNFRTFEELGILVRMSDKLARLRSFCESKSLAVKSESVRDTILDLINYAVLLHGYLVDVGALSPDAPVSSSIPR